MAHMWKRMGGRWPVIQEGKKNSAKIINNLLKVNYGLAQEYRTHGGCIPMGESHCLAGFSKLTATGAQERD